MLSLLQRQQREGPAWPALSACFPAPPKDTDHSSPTSLQPQFPHSKVGEGREEEKLWGEGNGGGTGLVGSSSFPGFWGNPPRSENEGIRVKVYCSPG